MHVAHAPSDRLGDPEVRFACARDILPGERCANPQGIERLIDEIEFCKVLPSVLPKDDFQVSC
jgi:hypothetical protein